MNALAALRLTLLAPVQPRRACTLLAAQPGTGWILAAAGVAHSLLAVVQWNVVSPVLARDPLFADWRAPGFVGAGAAACAAVAAPAALCVRAGVLGAVLRIAAAGARPCTWPVWAAWAACADGVLWIESAAATLVVHWAHPADLAALRGARLHAGLDLLWPEPAWLGTLNVFTFWWMALLAAGMCGIGRTSRRRALVTAFACAACRGVAQAVWNLW